MALKLSVLPTSLMSERHLMRRGLLGWSFLCALAAPVPALAQSPDEPGAGDRTVPRLGLDIGEPGIQSAPPAVPFGVEPATSKDSVLDFHGYVLLPLNMGLLRRTDPAAGQDGTVFHTPPLVPQNFRRFQFTGALPTPWVQLDLTYGNSTVAATVILAATAATEAEAFYDPIRQLGVNDAFVTMNLSDNLSIPFQLRAGAMKHRYGAMGAFDAGRYATPLIARVNAVGEVATTVLERGLATVVIEEGIGGQLGRPPTGLPSQGWNDFTDPNVGASYVAHLHAGISVANRLQVSLHFLRAWSQDDQSLAGTLSKGHIDIFGADARLTWGRLGHLYVGMGQTRASNAGVVGGVVEVLNARGGTGLVSEYLGVNSGGNGSLTTFGTQYDLSVARAMFGDKFRGRNPDLVISLFSIGTKISSDDPVQDGLLKLKGGAEVTYTAMSWLGVSGRLDHVRQDNDFNRRAFTIYTARLLLHTNWRSRDQFSLQYSHFTYGREVYVESGFPPQDNPGLTPDRDVLSLSVTSWW